MPFTRPKNTYAIALILIVLLILISILIVATDRQQFAREQQDQLTARATDLEQLLKQIAVLPAILASDPRLSIALSEQSAESQAQANAVLKNAAEKSDARFAFLIDTSGNVLAASNHADEVSFVGNNYGFRPYFSKAINGTAATFFAVGATTGIPGYFASEPVWNGSEVIGVVVVKLESSQLPVSWREGSSIALVTDELGVAILSTEQNMLYNSTSTLDPESKQLIENERRYQVVSQSHLDRRSESRWHHNDAGSATSYLVRSQLLDIEPWTLSLLVPTSSFNTLTLRKLLALYAVCLLGALLWRTYWQQVKLSAERAQLAKRLEESVNEKTIELQNAQNALIAESNFVMLGKMSAAINHEINQPLASLRFDLATLRQLIENENTKKNISASVDTENDKDSMTSTVIDLDRTAKRITRVIDTLRALPNQQKAAFVPLSVCDLIDEVTTTLVRERPLLSRALSLDSSAIDGKNTKISGEPILLQQALLNVLYNALDAIANAQPPWAELQAVELNNTLCIAVSDNGPGIHPSIASRVFEPFESAPDKTAGLGLGLTLTRQIIEDHGGTVEYRREKHAVSRDGETIDEPIEVTVFSITLPLLSS